MQKSMAAWTACVVVAFSVSSAWGAGIYITEFSSNSGNQDKYEFVEFTNVTNQPINMTGYSEDDSNRVPNKAQHDLSAFGVVAPHESVIFTEADPNDFRVYWWGSVEDAPADLKIIGPYLNDNLSSSGDEINLYNELGVNIDTLTYNPSTDPLNPNRGGTGLGVSRNPTSLAVLGTNSNPNWIDSAANDPFNSFQSVGGINMYGNPGSFPLPPVQPGDVNIDGNVNLTDLTQVASSWHLTGSYIPGDANGDGIVSLTDLTLVASHWGESILGGGAGASVTATPVPEPATGSLLLLGSVGLWVAGRIHSRKSRG